MKPFKYTETPDVDYQIAEKIETEDRTELVGFLAGLPGDTPVAWYSHKDERGHPGVWVRRGMYRLKHGSFVDPSDLSCYAAQYYEAFSGGRHECLQIGRSLQAAQKPEDAVAAPTVKHLMDAIDQLAPLPKMAMPAEDVAEEEVVEAVEADGALTERTEDAPAAQAEAIEHVQAAATVDEAPESPMEPQEPELKLLQPDYAFEMHGALTRGWHAQRYVTINEEGGVTHQLVILR